LATPSVQLGAGPQVVPIKCLRQCPPGSHVPTLPHDDGACAVHSLSQQTPSTQAPLAHARQPPTLQSVVRLQAEACAFCAWHVPSAAQ
jgi:hypothetical protein